MGYTKKPKNQKGNNNGWAEGVRQTVLEPYIQQVADAQARGSHHARIVMNKAFNEYAHRIDWRLPLHEEPAKLGSYDPLGQPVTL